MIRAFFTDSNDLFLGSQTSNSSKDAYKLNVGNLKNGILGQTEGDRGDMATKMPYRTMKTPSFIHFTVAFA